MTLKQRKRSATCAYEPLRIWALTIRERRRRLGMGQQELAQRVGVSRQWLIEAERGKPRAELALILKTLDVLRLRIQLDDEASSTNDDTQIPPPPDIDAIVEQARKRRPR